MAQQHRATWTLLSASVFCVVIGLFLSNVTLVSQDYRAVCRAALAFAVAASLMLAGVLWKGFWQARLFAVPLVLGCIWIVIDVIRRGAW
jgi:hypothetical protein